MGVAISRCSRIPTAGPSASSFLILNSFSFPLRLHLVPSFPDLPQAKKGQSKACSADRLWDGLRKICAGVRVIHQDLEHGAHVEVTAMNGDSCAPGLWAHGRLQRVDCGQLGRRKGIRLWLQACGE